MVERRGARRRPALWLSAAVGVAVAIVVALAVVLLPDDGDRPDAAPPAEPSTLPVNGWDPCGETSAVGIAPTSLEDYLAIDVQRAAVCEYVNDTGGGGCCGGPDTLERQVILSREAVETVMHLAGQTRPAMPNRVCYMIDSPNPHHYVFVIDDGERQTQVDVPADRCFGYQLGTTTYDSGRLPQVLADVVSSDGTLPSQPAEPCRGTRVVVGGGVDGTEIFPEAEGGDPLVVVDKPRAALRISGGCSSSVNVVIHEGRPGDGGAELPVHGQLRMPPGTYTLTVTFPTCAYSSDLGCSGGLDATTQVVEIRPH